MSTTKVKVISENVRHSVCHLIFYRCSWIDTSPDHFLIYTPVSACIFWRTKLSLSTLLWLVVRTDCEDMFAEKDVSLPFFDL